jgi:hypothetical protein
MKLTIIIDDKAVKVDGIKRIVDFHDCSIPGGIHALQWENDSGWIEYAVTKDGNKPENKSITELPKWANNCVAEWEKPIPPVV